MFAATLDGVASGVRGLLNDARGANLEPWVVSAVSLGVFSLAWEALLRSKAVLSIRRAGTGAGDGDAGGGVPNPFMNLRPKNYYRLRYLWPGAVLIPLRMLLIVGSLLNVSLVGLFITMTSRDLRTKPLRGWRRWVIATAARVTARTVLFCCGFHYIRVEGRRASAEEAPIVVGNHRGPFEAFYLIAAHAGCVVSRVENRFPVVRWAMDAMQVIFVDRRGGGRDAVKQALLDRSRPRSGWPQVLLFPEGTTTNGKALIKFKAGAFAPGAPVQPVAFEFPNSEVDIDPSWVFGVEGPGAGLVTVFIRLMASWHNPMTVRYLPVHVPTAEEKADWRLFAGNVREEIAAALGVPCTDHEQEDVLLAATALRSKLNPGDFVVEFGKMKQLFNMSLDTAKDLLEKFKKLDGNGDGRVSLDDVGRVLGLPADGQVLLNVFKTLLAREDARGTVNFREFLAAMAKMSGSMSTEDKIEACFAACDANQDGTVSFLEFSAMVRMGFRSVTKQQLRELFQMMASGDHITKEGFMAFMKDPANARYLVLFDLLRQNKESGAAADEPGSPLSALSGLSDLDASLSRRSSFSASRSAFLDETLRGSSVDAAE